MKLSPNQFDQHAKSGLLPIYWCCGDESLLVQEAGEALRRVAASQGFDERELHHVDSSFSWAETLTSANSLSLFASRKIIEIRLKAGKLDEQAGKALASYLDNPNPDTIILLISAKLDSNASRSKGYKLVDKVGGIVTLWPIEGYQLVKWIEQRLNAAKLKADQEACQLLADRVEGNLLAAVQEIEKLKLLVDGDTVTAKTVMQVVADSSRYTVFNLSDRMLTGNPGEALKVLNGLRGEGAEVILILWALTREVRILVQLASSTNINASFKQLRIFDRRQPIYRKALSRMSKRQGLGALDHCRRIDNMAKGAEKGNVWDELSLLVLTVCGHSLAIQQP
ncbi:DNA polymerase III subunit delta [Sinobacterium norvegicum]|uniref:DNA polymerase III subunit delta n=1 Tax=Sinobacterium norvegicum TaxID=1641715 RepID=A0ABM9AFA8_9GAMM|nr:DNA polymerase III subunit delta [Sinobacterium norvegicum]CAH0991638.1 DNA polymerase III subunit delta [Sinobacterium norvegicum]